MQSFALQQRRGLPLPHIVASILGSRLRASIPVIAPAESVPGIRFNGLGRPEKPSPEVKSRVPYPICLKIIEPAPHLSRSIVRASSPVAAWLQKLWGFVHGALEASISLIESRPSLLMDECRHVKRVLR